VPYVNENTVLAFNKFVRRKGKVKRKIRFIMTVYR